MTPTHIDFGVCFRYSIKMNHPHGSNLISQLASNAVLNTAFQHVYASRKSNHHNSAIWDLSLHWCNVIPKDCLYARYMDDWVICVKTRRQLRRIVKKMHGVLAQLKFNLAIDKTFIGRIAKGFDFLGYRFGPQGIMGLAHKTISNFIERLIRLYESDAMESRIDQYVRHWQRWCTAGL